MSVLTSQQRKLLEDACVRGRRASEQAVRAALGSLAVTADRPPAHLSEDDRQLRRGLRAKARQLGDTGDKLDLLIAECSYEQWHRLLFARFLAENNLLIHPEYRAPVTLEDCEELAESLGEPDGWAVAGRFAAEILPGIFRLNDPCVQLRLAPEGRLALEVIVADLPSEVFACDDALGWVYQFWQKELKDEVNRSERKIGGADLGPVTQLFTENYMVRFLLENSLGAWWAARHPDSPLIAKWSYLRLDEAGRPAAGSFDGWPGVVSEVTVMDPCCGSGHFLVEAFRMLWTMRAEEEGVDPISAQDSVLRDNLFGLELDPRCVQIAMFAVALQAWKSTGGWRELPIPNIACSGIPASASLQDWKSLAKGDSRLEGALTRLHAVFRSADELGSLIEPTRTLDSSYSYAQQRSFSDVQWAEVAPALGRAGAMEADDPAGVVLGSSVFGIARAADLLARTYVLVATNVPYLGAGKQAKELSDYLSVRYPLSRRDLATAMYERCLQMLAPCGVAAVVLPETWLFLGSYRKFREYVLSGSTWTACAVLGDGAFGEISGAVVRTILLLAEARPPTDGDSFGYVTVASVTGTTEKSRALRSLPLDAVLQEAQARNPDSRVTFQSESSTSRLGEFADALHGLGTFDAPQYTFYFWEIDDIGGGWELQQSAPRESGPVDGCTSVLRWEGGEGRLAREMAERAANGYTSGKWRAGRGVWGKRGLSVWTMGRLVFNQYLGTAYDENVTAIVPHDEGLLPALWAFAESGELEREVRLLDKKLHITPNTYAKVPFDRERWIQVAAEQLPDGLVEPRSDDPTQWLFEGNPDRSTEPLQVGTARLLGYRWPDQPESDGLDALGDEDGIVCLPSVRGERTAADRLQELLARAFGGTWSPARTHELLIAASSKKKDLDAWLRDDFFKAHCQVFKNRPFIWQIWDGRKDGFSALVNYHRLDRPTLEKLTYSYLGDWVERQAAGARDDLAGAEERLAAARGLQQRLELILEGEPPYDIYVRWKSLAEQPIGWEPDLNDGVRLNVRPFVEAGVLRSKFNVKWDKDRGKNPDGSERLNDLHYSHAEKRAARGESA